MKIAVLTSGGVDSSLALRLLHEQGHDVTAFYLKIWLEEELSYLGNCPWEEDLLYVQKQCDKLGVPLKVVPLQQEYWDRVVAYALDEVKAGRTPNPDMLCNQRVKFGAFFDFIETLDEQFDRVATGHYARVVCDEHGCQLRMSPDPVKDQTYFLAQLSQEQLARVLFPIGHLTKVQVRELAQTYDLASKDRKDSQGICFLGKIRYNDFLKHHLGTKPGDIVEFETGNRLGEHEGFWYHTIGQRKGLGLSGGPWYVVAKDADRNIVYVSNQYHSHEKERNQFNVTNCHWIAGIAPKKSNLSVKVRHGETIYGCTLMLDETGLAGSVVLDERDQGLAAGQFAVFYDGETCLGCGRIAL